MNYYSLIICAVIGFLLTSNQHCHAQNLGKGDLRGRSLSITNNSFESLEYGIQPLGFSTLSMPERPLTAADSLAIKKRFINDHIYPDIARDLDASIIKIHPAMVCATFIAGLFLKPQFSVPYGYYPTGSSVNPFQITLIPGAAPEINRYSPALIPQCIESVFDEKTGTYRQVMVSWQDYSKRMQGWHLGGYNNAAIKFDRPMNPVEREMHRINGM